MEKVDTQRLQEMSQTHHKVTFPEEKNGTVFLNTSIFFKRSQPEKNAAAAPEVSELNSQLKAADTEEPASIDSKASTSASTSDKIDDKAKPPSETRDPAKHKTIPTST